MLFVRFTAVVIAAAFFLVSTPKFLDAQATVTYTMTVGGIGTIIPEIGPDDTYTVDLVIDTAVEDINDNPDIGQYPGAILSSTITFSGGFESIVDFAGNELFIENQIAPSGVLSAIIAVRGGSTSTPGNGLLVFVVRDMHFESDAILVDPSIELIADPISLFILSELIGGGSLARSEPGTEAIFSISQTTFAGNEPGDVNRDGVADLLDVAPFVDLLLSGEFQEEADLNGDGIVDLLDIAPFVQLLVGG